MFRTEQSPGGRLNSCGQRSIGDASGYGDLHQKIGRLCVSVAVNRLRSKDVRLRDNAISAKHTAAAESWIEMTRNLISLTFIIPPAKSSSLTEMLTNPEPTKAILDKYVKINNPEFLAATYQDYVHITDQKAYPNIDGIRLALAEVAKRSPGAKGRKPEEFVNLRFLQELEKEGFYKELYSR